MTRVRSRLSEIIEEGIDRSGQDHLVTQVAADQVINAIEDALIEAAGGRDHIVSTDERGAWTIQHPLGERFEGSLFNCQFNLLTSAAAVAGAFGKNRRHRLILDRTVLTWDEIS